jgi:hypothetical protein
MIPACQQTYISGESGSRTLVIMILSYNSLDWMFSRKHFAKSFREKLSRKIDEISRKRTHFVKVFVFAKSQKSVFVPTLVPTDIYELWDYRFVTLYETNLKNCHSGIVQSGTIRYLGIHQRNAPAQKKSCIQPYCGHMHTGTNTSDN